MHGYFEAVMLRSAEIELWTSTLRRHWRRLRALAIFRLRKAFAPLPLGARGERAAAKFLKRQGCRIVAHGYRDRLGELDLVCVKDRKLIFVEVKTRRSEDAGQPVDAVNKQKQRRVTAAAERFIRRHDLQGTPVRFDVVSVVWPAESKSPKIVHYQNAYEAINA
jgi:putative endonuclease